MIFNTLFNNIYVINLESCVDRKTHIINEFNRVGIEKYEFFNAIKSDSQEVIDLMKSDKVKKFPTCFWCNQSRCYCKNNVLTEFQIGNWCSFINIFKDIIEKKYDFVLICEDDIVFSNQYKRIINKLLSPQAFKKYNIDMSKPLSIKMGAAFREENHNSNATPVFIKNYAYCNPCFAINKEMAYMYLSNLNVISNTSDTYFHKIIPKMYPSIQHLTMYPYPVYELSFVKSIQKFESTVRPTNGLRRIEYVDYLFLTTNILMNVNLFNYFKRNNYNILINSVGYNGNIHKYILLDENEKRKYYFENKYLIQDNYIDEIKLIYKIFFNEFNEKKESIYYSKYIEKINEVLKVSFTLDYNNLLKSAIYYFYYYVLLLKTIDVEIINISNLTVINDIKQKNTKLFEINFESYFNIKNMVLKSIEDSTKLDEDIKNIIDTQSLNFY
jgi:GR25 family glycosyltransferase involved in LPS biosynthesis